jgi:DNA-binding GntR family transcriptional regulator
VTLDRSAPELLRDQLADLIRAKIASGEWPTRTAIPSTTALAAEYDISADTVQKAIAILKGEGMLFGVTGKGTFVAERTS